MKFSTGGVLVGVVGSHLERGAWIEIMWNAAFVNAAQSHLERGAWIEIVLENLDDAKVSVAPRKRCVD